MTRHPVSLQYQLSQLISAVISGCYSSRGSFLTSSLCTSKCRLSSWVPNLPSGSSWLRAVRLTFGCEESWYGSQTSPQITKLLIHGNVPIKLSSSYSQIEMWETIAMQYTCTHHVNIKNLFIQTAISMKHEIKLMLTCVIKSLSSLLFTFYISWAIKNCIDYMHWLCIYTKYASEKAFSKSISTADTMNTHSSYKTCGISLLMDIFMLSVHTSVLPTVLFTIICWRLYECVQ